MKELAYLCIVLFSCMLTILSISDFLLSLFNNRVINSARMAAYRDAFFILCIIFIMIQLVKHLNN
jgi:hypothetical protein